MHLLYYSLIASDEKHLAQIVNGQVVTAVTHDVLEGPKAALPHLPKSVGQNLKAAILDGLMLISTSSSDNTFPMSLMVAKSWFAESPRSSFWLTSEPKYAKLCIICILHKPPVSSHELKYIAAIGVLTDTLLI